MHGEYGSERSATGCWPSPSPRSRCWRSSPACATSPTAAARP